MRINLNSVLIAILINYLALNNWGLAANPRGYRELKCPPPLVAR
jgi:hypothetical protein